MNEVTAEQICHSVAEASGRAREVLLIRVDTEEVLDRFWCVQDQLARFLDAASTAPEEFFNVQQLSQPGLISDVSDLVDSAVRKERVNRIAAVNQCCGSIGALLVKIARLKASASVYHTANA